MFNLLPENLKDKIKKDYKLRKITVILIFFVCVLFSALIFLLPSWLVSYYNEKEVVLDHKQMQDNLSDLNISSVLSTIKTINTKLNIINSNLDYPKILPYLNTILSKKTNSIHINNFTYNYAEDKTTEVTLGGVASTRESLVSFVKTLEESKSFSEVNLPISNLAKDKNIIFSIKMKISTE